MASVFRVGIGLFVSSARLLPFFAAVLALYSGGPLSGADGGSAAQEIRPALEKLIAEGTAAAKQGDPKLALSRFQDAVPLAERSQDENLLGAALSGLGWSQWATGQYEAALQTRRRALEIFRKLDNPAREAVILRGLGETFYSLGR